MQFFYIICINICYFSTIFYFSWHRPRLTQVSSTLCSCSISMPRKTRTLIARLAGNGHYDGNSFDVLASAMPLWPPRFRLPGAQNVWWNLTVTLLCNRRFHANSSQAVIQWSPKYHRNRFTRSASRHLITAECSMRCCYTTAVILWQPIRNTICRGGGHRLCNVATQISS